MSDDESHSESEFYYRKDEEQTKTEPKKSHIIDNLFTSSVRSLQENLRPGLDVLTSLSLGEYIQGLDLRFPCNDLTLG